MALSPRTLTSGSTGGGTASTFSVARPGGVQPGDVLVLCVASNNGTGAVQASCTDGTWNRLATGQDNAGTPNVGGSVFRRVVQSSEPASYAFTNVLAADDTTPQSVAYGYVLVGLTGAETTSPEDATPTVASTAAGNAPAITIPAITTQSDGAWVLALAVADLTGATWTAPTGYANLVARTTTRVCAGATLGPVSPAGTIPNTTFAHGSGGPGVGFAVAVRPAAPSGTSISGTGSLAGPAGTGSVGWAAATGGTGALAGLVSSGTATEQFALSGNGALNPLTSAGSLSQTMAVAGTGALPALTSTGTIDETLLVAGTGSLPGLDTAGAVTWRALLLGASTLGPLVGGGVLVQMFVVTGAGAVRGVGSNGLVLGDAVGLPVRGPTRATVAPGERRVLVATTRRSAVLLDSGRRGAEVT